MNKKKRSSKKKDKKIEKKKSKKSELKIVEKKPKRKPKPKSEIKSKAKQKRIQTLADKAVKNDGKITAKEVKKIKDIFKASGIKNPNKTTKDSLRKSAKKLTNKGKSVKVGDNAAKNLGIADKPKGIKKIEKGKTIVGDVNDTESIAVTPSNPKEETVKPQDINDLKSFDSEKPVDNLPKSDYNKRNVYNKGILNQSRIAAEKQLEANRKEWNKTKIDSLRIDPKKALNYRDAAWEDSLAGQYQSKDTKGRKKMMADLKKPIHQQVVAGINGKDPFNTFYLDKDGKIGNKLPQQRGSGIDHSKVTKLAEKLGAPKGGIGRTLDRLDKLKSGPKGGYKKAGKKLLGISLPSSKDIRDGMPEPLELPTTSFKKGRLKTPKPTAGINKFSKVNLNKTVNSNDGKAKV